MGAREHRRRGPYGPLRAEPPGATVRPGAKTGLGPPLSLGRLPPVGSWALTPLESTGMCGLWKAHGSTVTPVTFSPLAAPLPSRGEAGSSASCCTISRPRSSCITAVAGPAPERPSKNKANVTGRKTTEPGKAFLRTQSQRKVSIPVVPKTLKSQCFKKGTGASLVAQWLRICLSMQGTRVRALVREDPTCRGATRPVSHNY